MQIILWRHAEAMNGVDDLARELTDKGHKQAAKIANELRKRLPESYTLWVSEAKRSQQTAAYLKVKQVIRSEINPEAQPQLIAKLLTQCVDEETIVIVGHQPWIGQLCAFLLNQNWYDVPYWSVKKGAFWWFQAYPSNGVMLSKLKTMLSP